MYAANFAKPIEISRRFRALLFAALLFTFLLVVMGTLLRTGSAGSACPDWPTCFGSLSLPTQDAARLEVVHRALAALSGLLTLSVAVWVGRKFAAMKPVAIPVLIALTAMLAEIAQGAWIASAPFASPVHLALALIALGGLSAAFLLSFQPQQSVRLSLAAPFSRLALAAASISMLLLISGALVSTLNAADACATWPLCTPTSPLSWLALGHRAIVLAAFIVQAALFARAWRSQRSQPVTLTAVTAGFVLILGQAYLGALQITRSFPADLIALHAAASAAFWAVQIVTLTAALTSQRSATDEAEEADQPLPFRSRAKDFLILNKPIIVLLLLVTTYAGMVVGGKAIPSLELTLWTLLGGALSAGGASALNQYIDRETDKAMQRTAKRPLPSGRMMPAEGLAYGTGAVLASFFLLAGFVNLLAALLSLAGMVYYVLIYSIWLKHATVQNIVIGGGAGAIPPLVGWAAATGSLNIPSLFLFAIIFFWTPPHFWALALVRKNDYARGNVPMLPVVRGEKETRKQVFLYTLELVGLTLLMPLFNMAGSVYLISALGLGAWLIFTAWRVLVSEGNKTAWTMYRSSSMYLAFLFLALVLDVLIR